MHKFRLCQQVAVLEMRIQINAVRNELAQVLYIAGFNQIMHL